MKTECYVKKAKNKDKDAYNYLYNHYFNRYVNSIVKNYGKEYEQRAKELYPMIFDNYINNDYKGSIINYFSRASRQRYLFEENSDLRRSYVTSRLKDLTYEHFNQLVERYGNNFYNKLKNYNTILSDEELMNFSKSLIAYYLKSNIKKYNIKNIIPSINGVIYDEINAYKKDSDNLIKRYLSYYEVNDKILNYYTKKYEYLINENNNKFYYLIKDNYHKIVLSALNKVRGREISVKISTLINKEIIRLKKIYINAFEKIELDKQTIKRNENYLRQSYDYLIRQYYDAYKDTIKNDNLLELITKKYNEFFDSYINGGSNSSIGKYITTRLGDYTFKLFNYANPNVDRKALNEEIINNTDILFKSLNRYRGYYPACNLIENMYVNAFYEYYKSNRKTDIRDYVNSKISNYTRQLNSYYNESYLDNIIIKFSNCNVIPSYLKTNYFRELKEYYLNNELYKKIPFDKYLCGELKSFDYNEYLKVKDIKEKLNKKVLKRP